MKYLNISILGSGNLGSQLATGLENAGHRICEIWSRTEQSAAALAGQLYEAEATTDENFSESKAEVFLMAVPDDAIASLTQRLVLPDGSLLVHTSASRSLEDLATYASGPKGILYPVQTFSKVKPVQWDKVPICIETDTEEGEALLYPIATSLSKEIYWLNHQQRLGLHVAAVFASNFTNHMLHLAKNLCDSEEMSFAILKPLIKETVEKALTLGPDKSQTGPAIRRDRATLSRHMKYLEDNRELCHLYERLSQSIVDNG